MNSQQERAEFLKIQEYAQLNKQDVELHNLPEGWVVRCFEMRRAYDLTQLKLQKIYFEAKVCDGYIDMKVCFKSEYSANSFFSSFCNAGGTF